MLIQYYGQSCFRLTTESGVRIVTDPFGGIGISMPRLETEIVTVSHGHFDHNNIKALSGDYRKYESPGSYEDHGVKIKGIKTFHDDANGAKRGENTVFIIEADGLRICHAGDLGHIPSDKTISEIGKIDVLMMPVGEVFTLSIEQAVETIKLLNPAVTIPMHYRAKLITLPLKPVDKFLKSAGEYKKTGDKLEITKASISDFRGIAVMEK